MDRFQAVQETFTQQSHLLRKVQDGGYLFIDEKLKG